MAAGRAHREAARQTPSDSGAGRVHTALMVFSAVNGRRASLEDHVDLNRYLFLFLIGNTRLGSELEVLLG